MTSRRDVRAMLVSTPTKPVYIEPSVARIPLPSVSFRGDVEVKIPMPVGRSLGRVVMHFRVPRVVVNRGDVGVAGKGRVAFYWSDTMPIDLVESARLTVRGEEASRSTGASIVARGMVSRGRDMRQVQRSASRFNDLPKGPYDVYVPLEFWVGDNVFLPTTAGTREVGLRVSVRPLEELLFMEQVYVRDGERLLGDDLIEGVYEKTSVDVLSFWENSNLDVDVTACVEYVTTSKREGVITIPDTIKEVVPFGECKVRIDLRGEVTFIAWSTRELPPAGELAPSVPIKCDVSVRTRGGRLIADKVVVEAKAAYLPKDLPEGFGVLAYSLAPSRGSPTGHLDLLGDNLAEVSFTPRSRRYTSNKDVLGSTPETVDVVLSVRDKDMNPQLSAYHHVSGPDYDSLPAGGLMEITVVVMRRHIFSLTKDGYLISESRGAPSPRFANRR